MVTSAATTKTITGYSIADLILLLIASIFSLYVATLSSIVSNLPDSSPASVKLVNRRLKCTGCLLSATLKAEPDSTSRLSSVISFSIDAFSCPWPIAFNVCAIGMPAPIIVAICLEAKLISALFIGLELENSGFGLRLSFCNIIPRCRSITFAWAAVGASSSPLTEALLSFKPSH